MGSRILGGGGCFGVQCTTGRTEAAVVAVSVPGFSQLWGLATKSTGQPSREAPCVEIVHVYVIS